MPTANSGDRIFMDLGGRHLVVLSLPIGAALLIALLAGSFFLAITRGGLLRSSIVVVGTTLGTGILSWLLLALVGAVRPGMFWRAEPIWTHLTLDAATMLIAALLLVTLGGTLDRTRLRATFWFLFLVLGGAIGLIAPGGIVFFIFPPLVAAIGMITGRWWRPAERIASCAAIAVLYLTWGAMLGLLQELLNNGPMWVFGPLGSLLILPVLIESRPLIAGGRVRGSAAVPAALTLLGVVAVLAAPAYSADRQQRFVIQHVTDAAHGKNWWSLLNDGAALPAGFGGRWQRGELPFSDRTRWISPAPVDASARAPDVQLLSQVQASEERTLTIRLRANGNEHVDLIAPPDARIRSAGVSGSMRPIDQKAEGRYSIGCFGRSCDGAVLQLTIGKLTPVSFVVLGGKAQLPPSAAPLLSARPRFARPQYSRDETIAFAIRRL